MSDGRLGRTTTAADTADGKQQSDRRYSGRNLSGESHLSNVTEAAQHANGLQKVVPGNRKVTGKNLAEHGTRVGPESHPELADSSNEPAPVDANKHRIGERQSTDLAHAPGPVVGLRRVLRAKAQQMPVLQ